MKCVKCGKIEQSYSLGGRCDQCEMLEDDQMIDYGYTIKVDVEKIALGLIDIIKESGQESIVKFGMLPADIMKSFKVNLDRRFPDNTIVLGDHYIPDGMMKKIKFKIVHDVSVAIFSNTKMVV